jgi:hypothetical protein
MSSDELRERRRRYQDRSDTRRAVLLAVCVAIAVGSIFLYARFSRRARGVAESGVETGPGNASGLGSAVVAISEHARTLTDAGFEIVAFEPIPGDRVSGAYLVRFSQPVRSLPGERKYRLWVYLMTPDNTVSMVFAVFEGSDWRQEARERLAR